MSVSKLTVEQRMKVGKVQVSPALKRGPKSMTPPVPSDLIASHANVGQFSEWEMTGRMLKATVEASLKGSECEGVLFCLFFSFFNFKGGNHEGTVNCCCSLFVFVFL